MHPIPKLVLDSGFGFSSTDSEQLHWLQGSLGARAGTQSLCLLGSSGSCCRLDVVLAFM